MSVDDYGNGDRTMTNQPKPAPTAEEQLPPYDERYVELTEDLGTEDGDSDVMVRLALDCRERQLLAALAEGDAALRSNREKDAQLANFEDVLESMKELDKSRNPCGHLARYGFTDNGGKTAFCTLCELAVDLLERAEAAEAQLRAVSEALDKHGHDQWVHASVVDLFARLRSIVDGKDSVPTSPQPPR